MKEMSVSDFNTISTLEFNFFRVGEVAKRTGLTPDAIERLSRTFRAFVGPLKEAADGARLWSEEQVELINRIAYMNRVEGLSFGKIRGILEAEQTRCALTNAAQDRTVIQIVNRVKEENGLMREAMRRLGELAKHEIDNLKRENEELKHALNMLMYKLEEMHSHELEGRYYLQGIVSEKMREFAGSLARLEEKLEEDRRKRESAGEKSWFERFKELLSA